MRPGRRGKAAIREPGDLPSSSSMFRAGCPGAVRRAARRIPARRAAAPVELAVADKTSIYVCVTCRSAGQPLEPKEERAGFRLFAALEDLPREDNLALVPVECLSVCKRPCTVSFAAPGKWTYVYGDLPDEAAAPVILEGARLYAQAADGLIPWKARPDALKKGVVARIPPLEAAR